MKGKHYSKIIEVEFAVIFLVTFKKVIPKLKQTNSFT